MNRDTLTGDERAQTAQDFAVGIGLFLLAVAFVFLFVPDVISPFEAGVGAADSSQADRAATTIVGNLSADDRPNELDADRTDAYFESLDEDDLHNRTGLPFSARINVTVTEVDWTEENYVNSTGTTWTAGSKYRQGLGGASMTRIVRTDEPEHCEPACRLVVRVW